MTNESHETPETQFIEQLEQAHTRLYSYIHMLVQDVNDADDVFQQTTLVLWRKYATFDTTMSFLSWACGIARYEALNYLRKQQRRPVVLSSHIDTLIVASYEKVDADERERNRSALAGCIGKLRGNDQQLLKVHYTGRLSVRQIAEQMQRSPQSIHNSLRRIRGALLECVRATLAAEAH